uniref:Uncharacterized protein n=1 Tax=Plectus sambesii TaxID=2011161 RepID=A0A914VQL2_9BILA
MKFLYNTIQKTNINPHYLSITLNEWSQLMELQELFLLIFTKENLNCKVSILRLKQPQLHLCQLLLCLKQNQLKKPLKICLLTHFLSLSQSLSHKVLSNTNLTRQDMKLPMPFRKWRLRQKQLNSHCHLTMYRHKMEMMELSFLFHFLKCSRNLPLLTQAVMEELSRFHQLLPNIRRNRKRLTKVAHQQQPHPHHQYNIGNNQVTITCIVASGPS